MALSKETLAITQLTATGNSDELDISDAYGAVFSIQHDNGSGTVSSRGTVQPMISHDGVNFFEDGPIMSFSTTEGAIDVRTYIPPAIGFPIAAVRFDYTAPGGTTGHTLDVQGSKTVSLL